MSHFFLGRREPYHYVKALLFSLWSYSSSLSFRKFYIIILNKHWFCLCHRKKKTKHCTLLILDKKKANGISCIAFSCLKFKWLLQNAVFFVQLLSGNWGLKHQLALEKSSSKCFFPHKGTSDAFYTHKGIVTQFQLLWPPLFRSANNYLE